MYIHCCGMHFVRWILKCVAELGWDLGLRFQAISAMSISLPEQVGLGFQAISAYVDQPAGTG